MPKQRSLKNSLGWLVAAVFIPLLATVVVFLADQWNYERERAVARLRESARALQGAVDRELTLDQTVLQALAASRDIDTRDWVHFDRVARQTSEVRPGSWFVLFDRDGQQLVNTGVPPGVPLPNVKQLGTATHGDWQGRRIPMPNPAELLGPLIDGRTRFTGLNYGPAVKRPVVGTAVAVARDGAARYSLTLAYGAEFFQRIVGQAPNARDMLQVIVDGTGLIVARNRRPETYVGTPGVGVFEYGVAPLPREGIGESVSVEGIRVLFAYYKSDVNDWAMAVGLAERDLEAPAWRRLGIWLAVLSAAGLVGALVAARLWYQLAIPLAALAQHARNLGNEKTPLPPSDIAEVAALNRALREAARNAEALRATTAELEEADKRRTAFLSMLSHELRNPLAAIANVTALLARGATQPAQTSGLYAVLQRQTRHLARMVDDLLDVARITRGKIQLRPEALRLDELAREVAADGRSSLDARAHRLTLSTPAPVWVEGDEARLKQVLGNLLDNAAKYTEPGGEITIEVGHLGDDALLRVRDNGPGIDAALLPHVFEPFTQGPRSLERSEGGLGIGLSLVKMLVELHGGDVEVVSAPGAGATFTVRLPAVAQANAPVTLTAPHAAAATQRILVVEDNVDTADSLAMLLRLEGNDAQVAYDGVTGLEKARRWQPDAIVLDIGLPTLSGHEVCRALRGEPWGRRLAIIAVTGWGQEDDYEASRDAGFDGHLVKPVSSDAVLALLAQIRAQREGAARE